MIQVNILRDRNEVVKGIDINGHAGYAEYGQEICAAVFRTGSQIRQTC